MLEQMDTLLFPMYVEKQAQYDATARYLYNSQVFGEPILITGAEGKVIEQVVFTNTVIGILLSNGMVLVAAHEPDCCESVELIDGGQELKDLVGAKFIRVDKVTSHDDPSIEKSPDSYTWSYLNVYTDKGKVQLRWYGSSNGYYSEEANWYITTTSYSAWCKQTMMASRHCDMELGNSGAKLVLHWRPEYNDWVLAIDNKGNHVPLSVATERDQLLNAFTTIGATINEQIDPVHSAMA